MENIMKITFLALLLFTVGALSQSGCAKAQVRSTTDPEWKYLTKDEDDGLEWETYYDVNSIKRTTGVVTVWLKQLPVFKTEEQKQKLIHSTIENRGLNKMDTKGYEKFAYSQMLVEIDCNGKSGRNVSIKDFDERGTLLGSDTKQGVPFAPVRDGSLAGLLLKAVCN